MTTPPARSPVLPKYYQVEQLLRRRIAEMDSGQALPSEPDLAKEYAVSRSTVRTAIEVLAGEGLLLRLQGRGTFVVDGKIEFPVGYHKRSSAPEIDELSDHDIIEFGVSRHNAWTQTFGIGPREPVLELTRVTRLNGVPMGIGRLSVPRRLLPGAKKSDFEHGRFFYNLADLGIRIHRYRVTIESVIIDAELGALIGVRAGVPGLGLTRLGYVADGSVAAIAEITTRGDLARYVMDVESGEVREQFAT